MKTKATALVLAALCANTGCATMTGLFELGGLHWSDGGHWQEVTPISPHGAPVSAVLVSPSGPQLTCYRVADATITSFSARYTTMYKLLAGFMFVSEAAFTAVLLSHADGQTGAQVAGALVGADALATLGLMLFTHTKLESTEAPPPQFTVVVTCPPDTGLLLGERFLAVDEHGSFRDADASLSDAIVAEGPRHLRVAGRTVPVPLSDAERTAKSPVLVVLERPSFVVPWPVETPVMTGFAAPGVAASGGTP